MDLNVRTTVTLTPISPAVVDLFKAIRLAALLDTPTAFGSTHSKESQYTDSEWQARATLWSGAKWVGYLAFADKVACGIAAGFFDGANSSRASLLSMWVAPTRRRLGIGKQLVEAVSKWASSKNAKSLCLLVTSNNSSAIGFYERLGFIKAGRSEPHPNDPALAEFEMNRMLQSSIDQMLS